MPGKTNENGETIQSIIAETMSDRSLDFKVEFEHYLAQAAQLPDPRQVCRANTDVVRANIRRGVASLSKPEVVQRIREELPTVDLESMKDLPRLGETLAHAARLVMPLPKSEEVTVAVARGRVIRNSFINQLEVLANVGIVTEDELEQLRGGKGNVNLANDLVDSVALFKRHEAELVGKLAITPELIAEGATLGNFLSAKVSPPSAVKAQADGNKNSAAEIRDQLWTLLVHRYQELRRVAKWLWLDKADKYVPPLKAYQRRRKSQEEKVLETTEASTEVNTAANTEAVPV